MSHVPISGSSLIVVLCRGSEDGRIMGWAYWGAYYFVENGDLLWKLENIFDKLLDRFGSCPLQGWVLESGDFVRREG